MEAKKTPYKPKPLFPAEAKVRDHRIPQELAVPPLMTTVCAPRRSGKSALIYGLIDDVYAKIFDKVVILSDLVEYDESVKVLAGKRHKNIYYTDEVTNDSIRRILEEQKEASKRGKTLLMFLDDAGDDAMSSQLNREMSKIYTRLRHVKGSAMVAIQSVRGQLTNKMKNCSTEWIVFKNAMEDMKILSRTLASAYKTEREVLAYLLECTEVPYSFCYIDRSAGNARDMYRFCTPAEGFRNYFE